MGRSLHSAIIQDVSDLHSRLKSPGMTPPEGYDVIGWIITKLQSLDGFVDDAEQLLLTGGLKSRDGKWLLHELEHAVYPVEEMLWPKDMTTKLADKDVKDAINRAIKKLEGVQEKKENNALGLTERPVWRETLQGLPSSSAALHNYFHGKYPRDCFCGRDEEVRSMLQSLLSTGGSEQQHVKVISIEGRAGVGKTAFADVIYFNHKVMKSFELRAWLTLPYKATVNFMANKILEAVTEGEFVPGDIDPDVLRKRLQESFAGKRFLLVLDDLWIVDNLHEWSMLVASFESAARGSAIILTSSRRHDDPRELTIPASHTVPLYSLSTDDAWSIFLAHASSGQMDLRDERPDLAAVGKQIVKKLENLPLAAKMVGSLLQDNRDRNQWDGILRSKLLHARNANLPYRVWHPFQDVDDLILPIPSFLPQCYLDLPGRIKRCFAYLSLFPKGYQFKQKEVVHLWMAEGFLKIPDSESSGKSMEDIGDEYFGYLIKRSFLQPLGSGVSFTMHNLVHDLLSYAFAELYMQHLSYHGSIEGFLKILARRDGFFIRTILLVYSPLEQAPRQFDPRLLEHIIEDLTPHVFRVLSLSHHDVTNLPDSIGRLSHLCYLDLSYTAIQKLPDTICDLVNLQTLLLTNCTSLTSLPRRICNLVNLHYLDVRRSGVQEMPLQMDKLMSLRTLTDFIVSKNRPTLGDLAGLSNIETLTISELQNLACGKDASDAKLEEKKSLDDLKLQWGNDNDSNGNEMEVLENLEPHKDLKRLAVEYYRGARFPNWLGDPSYWALQSVALRHCENCNSLPKLGLLPFLKDLIIEGFTKVSSIGLEFYGEMIASQKPFQSLESLHFQDMLEWKEWNILEGIEFPCLVELCIIRCPNLVGDLPKQLLSLKKLEIIGCPDLATPLPKVSNTCEVFVHESAEILMRNAVKSHPQASLRRVTVSEEVHEITPQSYSDFPGTSIVSEIEEIPHEARMETESAGSRLPLDSSSSDTTRIPELKETSSGILSHQVESDIPNIKQQTDPQSSMATADIPITPKAVVLPLSDTPKTTAPVKVETLSEEDLDDQRSSFEVLKVSTISQLKSLPPMLHSLKIEECESLEALPDDLLGEITTLKELYLISCSSLRCLPYPGSLTKLYMRNCRRLEFLPSLESRKKLSFLRHLFIGSSCDSLTTLPLNLFSQLRTLCIWSCPNLLSFDVTGEPTSDLASLQSLEIRDCPRLSSFPNKGLRTPNLGSILLSNCKNLKKLPNAMNSLTSLKSLFLHRCPQIESFPSGGLPSSLVFLSIAYCDKLTPQKDWGLYSLESLDHFELEGGCIGVESFPEEKSLPCNINSLLISTMKSLKKLDYKGFQHLNTLQTLEIHCCDMLRSLPDQGLPSSLNRLCVQACPLLTPRLKPMTGYEWQKVAHIPDIQIDHQVLS